MFATPDAAFGTVDHDMHRMRRAAMNPFFSKASVRRLQPIIHERIEKLMSRIEGFQSSGEPLTISLAYVAFSSGKKLSSLSLTFLTCDSYLI